MPREDPRRTDQGKQRLFSVCVFKALDKNTVSLTPLWEVFIRPGNGLHHKHVGSLHAADQQLAIRAARDVYTRRGEGNSIWVVRSSDITASDPDFSDENFSPSLDKVYRHPSFYDIPDDIENM